MELLHLRYFVAVADAGQFTAAAARVGAAQSSVSWAIGRLEADLGVILFERTTRSVQLTAHGRALLPEARRAVSALDRGLPDGRTRVDHRQLECFVTVVDVGGFTRAAERWGTSQPTISATIRRLEHALATRLFERHTRTVTLTPAGLAFLPHARAIVLAVERARAAVTDTGSELRSEVRVGSVPAPLGLDMVRFVADLQREHPGLTPRLVTRRTPEELLADVRDARVDLALSVTLAPDTPPPGVELIALDSEPFVLQVAPGHRLAGQATVSVDQLREEPFVCFPSDNSQRAGMDGVFARLGLEPEIAFECDGPAHLRLVLDAGVCCLGLARRTAFIEPAIRNIPLDVETPRAHLVLALPHEHRRSAPARAVAEALLDALR